MRVAFAGLLVLAAVLIAGCGDNPNEDVEADEFIRPASQAERSEAQDQDEADEGAAETEPEERQQSDGEAEDDGEQSEDAAPAQPEDQADQSDQSGQSDQSDQAEQAQQAQPAATADDDEEEDDTPLQLSEDVVRRYVNPSYGYSLELVCSPFCDASSNGIDVVSFVSETGRALIDVRVQELETAPDRAEVESLLRDLFQLAEAVEFEVSEPVQLLTGGTAENLVWSEDRRAQGGFLVQWQAYAAWSDGLLYLVRAGAVEDDYEGVAPALMQALDSLILPPQARAQPGEYERFGFSMSYDTSDLAQEFGQPTSNPPARDSGVFVLQSGASLKAVLSWQVIGEGFFNADTAITQSLEDTLGILDPIGFRDAGTVDGAAARAAATTAPLGEGEVEIVSYGWYCRDGGREFALHVLDANDAEAVAVPLLASFRCSAAAAE